jgi:hypothetical protein
MTSDVALAVFAAELCLLLVVLWMWLGQGRPAAPLSMLDLPTLPGFAEARDGQASAEAEIVPKPALDTSLFDLCQTIAGPNALPILPPLTDLRPVLAILRSRGLTGDVPQKAIAAAMQAYCAETDLRPMGPQALARALSRLKCTRKVARVPRKGKIARITTYDIGGDVIEWSDDTRTAKAYATQEAA